VRDIKIATIYEGTNSIQAIDFVMRKILKDGGKSISALSAEIVATVQGLDDATFKKEKELFGKVLMSAQAVMQHISTHAQKNKFNMVLQHCTDFQQLAAQMVVGWRLMESAKVAQKKLAGASGDEKAFLESKIVDFKTYCTHFLVHNLSYAKTITDYEDDVTALEV